MLQISTTSARHHVPQSSASIPLGEASDTQERFMRIQEVSDVCGLSRATIYARMKAKTFPAQIAIGTNSVGWLASDINNWMQARIASRTH